MKLATLFIKAFERKPAITPIDIAVGFNEEHYDVELDRIQTTLDT